MNKSGDENRSVRNTKHKLRVGLMQLLSEKPINQISVKELTELVDVNRGTFYFHYNDIYDMLHKTQEDFFRQFEQVLSSFRKTENDGVFYFEQVFIFIKENSDIAKILLSKNADMEFLDKLKDLLYSQTKEGWRKLAGLPESRELSMYSAFIIAGCVGVINKWLDTGAQESPAEIAKLADTIINASLLPYIKKEGGD